tara:strand:- start:175 stop:375 length:201 start_codon:yes stop_codon:yes gene_type:complete
MTSKLIKLVVASLMLVSVPACKNSEKETDNEKSKRKSGEHAETTQKEIKRMIAEEEASRQERLNKK